MLNHDHAMQSALGDAAKQDGTQGVVAIAKKAQDLYRQQQEIQKKLLGWRSCTKHAPLSSLIIAYEILFTSVLCTMQSLHQYIVLPLSC